MSEATRGRGRRWLKRGLQVLVGLVLGLVAAEVIFRVRDQGAFPHVNMYRPDAELGVRLEPGASQKIAFGGNPVTSLRVNAQGYRGADWPAPTPAGDEIIVVGDSQVFGLGVEEDETFSARLGARLAAGGKPAAVVRNAGVPTYGPREYQAVAAELLASRKAKTVIFTVNLSNDLFEVDRPNRDRHVVWDGWAVRRETATAAGSGTQFPGRRWLMSQSHAVFAVRKWLHQDAAASLGVASEGTWNDLVDVSATLAAEEQARREAQAKRAEHGRALAAEEARLVAAEQAIDSATRRELNVYEARFVVGEDEEGELEPDVLELAKASPGDIVNDQNAEASRPVLVTAELLRRGVAARRKLREQLLAKAKARRTAEILASFASRDEAAARIAALDAEILAEVPEVASPLLPVFRELKSLCDQHGARLVILILPLDVQVSADEWTKYGKEVRDMRETRVLATELVAEAAALGVTAVDATAALEAASPGAFLNRDLHMTAKGHAAVAAALEAALEATPPSPRVIAPTQRAGAPGRSAMPVPAAWDAVGEIRVSGSTAAGCETKRVREWLRVACRRRALSDATQPNGITVLEDPTGEAAVLLLPAATTLVVPLVAGQAITADFHWTTEDRRLRVTWPDGAEAPTLAFEATRQVQPPRSPVGLDDRGKRLSRCWRQIYGRTSVAAYGDGARACHEAYPDDCVQLLACLRRDPLSPPAATAAPATPPPVPVPPPAGGAR